MRRFGRGIGLESLERRLPMACDVSSGAYCESLELVADIDQSTHPAEIVASHIEGDTLYYVRDTDVALELWRQTADESELLSEIYVRSSSIPAMKIVGDNLYFAVDGVAGGDLDPEPSLYAFGAGETYLWTYDLDAEEIRYLGVLGDWFKYFGHTNVKFYDDGGELLMVVEEMAGPTAHLWTSDGTREGTVPYTEEFGVQYIGSAQELVPFNDAWYFIGGREVEYGLWSTVPGEGMTLIREFDVDLPMGVRPFGLGVVEDQLQFTAPEEFGDEFWVSDGTAEGTRVFMDLVPGSHGSHPRPLHELDGQFWFQARTGEEFAWEVWTTDWTVAGTERFSPLPEGFAGISDSIVFDGAIYIELWMEEQSSVWRMDANSVDFVFGAQSYGYISNFQLAGDRLFFRTNAGSLWVTDGQSDPVEIGDYELLGANGTNSVVHFQRDGQIYALPDDRYIPGLVSSHDGIPGSSRPFSLGFPQNRFSVVTFEREFWVEEDGQLVSSSLDFPAYVSGPVLTTKHHTFLLEAGEFSHGLISYDPVGNELTTLIPTDFPSRYAATVTDESLVFLAVTDSILEIWESDGTLDGLSRTPLRNRLSVRDQVVENHGLYYFTARDFSSENNREPHLWVTNGTADSTLEIAPISGLAKLARYRDGVIAWVPNDADDGETELVLFNATSEPTTIVRHAFDTGPEFTQMATRGEHIYFVEGNRLWYHNGQPGVEARLVVEFPELSLPDYGSALIDNLTVVDHRVFFTVDDGMHGTELWVTDGTKHGTVMAVDVNSGHMPSLPRHLTIHNDQLYFTALTREHGREIWSIDLQDDHAPVNSDISDDGQTDFADFLLLSSNFGNRTNNGVLHGDLDHDGTVDFADFLLLSREIAARLDAIE